MREPRHVNEPSGMLSAGARALQRALWPRPSTSVPCNARLQTPDARVNLAYDDGVVSSWAVTAGLGAGLELHEGAQLRPPSCGSVALVHVALGSPLSAP
jgi:hypothetical protein